MIYFATGHRPDKLYPGHPKPYSDFCREKMVEFLVAELGYNHPIEANDEMLCGMALGFDQAIAEACLALGIRFTAMIPCQNYESKWPKYSQDYYHSLVARASSVRFMQDEYTPDCLQKRNERMAIEADCGIAMWNGTPGGTSNCLRFATRICCPVDNMWDHWERHWKETYKPRVFSFKNSKR